MSRTLGTFRLVRELGRGGLGVVWQAEDPGSGRIVALKQLLAPDSQLALRFRREGELLARVRHPGVVRVHEVLDLPGGPVLVMERVEGVPLERLGRALEARRAVELVAGLARAVEAMHAAGVVHRDIKPANALLTPQGQAVLIDFGLATASDVPSLTATGALLGTPAYMAPEQARSGAADARTDVHALGGVLLFLLTGRDPYSGSSPIVVLEKAAAGRVDWPAAGVLDPGLEALLRRALAPAPGERFPSAGVLAGVLEGWLRGAAPARAPRRVAWALGGVAALAAPALLAAAWVVSDPGSPQPAPAGPAEALPSAPSPPAPPPDPPAQRALVSWPAAREAPFVGWLSWRETDPGEEQRVFGWSLRLQQRWQKEEDGRRAMVFRLTGVKAEVSTRSGGAAQWDPPRRQDKLLEPLIRVAGSEGQTLTCWLDPGSGAISELKGAEPLEGIALKGIPRNDEFRLATLAVVAASLSRALPACLELVHHLGPGGDGAWEVLSHAPPARGRPGVTYLRRMERRSPTRVTFRLAERPAGPPVPVVALPEVPPHAAVELTGSVGEDASGVRLVEATQRVRYDGRIWRETLVRWEREGEE